MIPQPAPPRLAELDGITLHYRVDGDPEGAPIVFANSLGTDFRIWDDVVSRLPADLRIIRYDKRGHGLSECPPAPYAMGTLVRDLEHLLDRLEVKEAVLVGLSIGGMIAQGLAAKRLDLIRGLVLSNTAAKIGTREIWQDRIEAAQSGGLSGILAPTMERWFPEPFRSSPEGKLAQRLFLQQPVEGWVGCAAAISGTDFMSTTSTLRLPTLALVGDRDGSTPPDLMRETADLIPGSEFHIFRGAGHLPCIDAAPAYAARLTQFLRDIGHL